MSCYYCSCAVCSGMGIAVKPIKERFFLGFCSRDHVDLWKKEGYKIVRCGYCGYPLYPNDNDNGWHKKCRKKWEELRGNE